jgi:hypothetical protein
MSIGRGGKELRRETAAQNGRSGPADRDDEVQPVASKLGRMRRASRTPAPHRSRVPPARDFNELNGLSRQSDQIPHERVGETGLWREGSLGRRQDQHVPGLARAPRPTAGRGAAAQQAKPASNCREAQYTCRDSAIPVAGLRMAKARPGLFSLRGDLVARRFGKHHRHAQAGVSVLNDE